MDKRLCNLSHSGRLLLHSCPRKFQLSKLNATVEQEESFESSVTLSFGTIVGLGVQLCLEGKSEEEILFRMALEWKPDFFAVNDKQKKSLSYAIGAVQNFISLRNNGFLDEWELVYHDGKPAVELSFRIHLPADFKYRGFVDAVLRNKKDGRIMVLECKTTSASYLNASAYKNSGQGVGYSVVLDHLFPAASSYEVLYLVYLTKNFSWEPLPFTKLFLSRALWLQELLIDTQELTRYEELGVYPMHGESCNDWNRECEYFSTCTLSTHLLTSPMSQEEEAEYDAREAPGAYQFEVSFEDLIRSQLSREAANGEAL